MFIDKFFPTRDLKTGWKCISQQCLGLQDELEQLRAAK